MLKLNLETLFKAKGIVHPYAFLVSIGFSTQTATNIIQKRVKSLKFDQIERLCTALLCEPNDLFVYIPKTGHPYRPDFPLLKLQPKQDLIDLVAYTKSLTYNELQDFLNHVHTLKDKKE